MENPQANSILKGIHHHQVISSLVRTFDLENNYLDKDDPWSGILAATYFAVWSTYRTMLQSTPGQLVFGSDMILNTSFIVHGEAIRRHNQNVIGKNNRIENKKRKLHTYRIWDKVLAR